MSNCLLWLGVTLAGGGVAIGAKRAHRYHSRRYQKVGETMRTGDPADVQAASEQLLNDRRLEWATRLMLAEPIAWFAIALGVFMGFPCIEVPR